MPERIQREVGKYDELKAEIKVLINTGKKLATGLSLYSPSKDFKKLPKEDSDKIVFFFKNYEKWYTKSLAIIKVLLPDRYADFSLLYRNEKRKQLTWQTYTLSDATQEITTNDNSLHPHHASTKLYQQLSMVEACLDKFESKISDIHSILQADVFDSEIESSRHLLSRGFLRAAGAVCGVVIEKHLSEICRSHLIETKKKTPTIADYNDALKDIVYDTIEWRRIQRLGDLRNLCDHNKDREPSRDEVEELINGTERIIKTIF